MWECLYVSNKRWCVAYLNSKTSFYGVSSSIWRYCHFPGCWRFRSIDKLVRKKEKESYLVYVNMFWIYIWIYWNAHLLLLKLESTVFAHCMSKTFKILKSAAIHRKTGGTNISRIIGIYKMNSANSIFK